MRRVNEIAGLINHAASSSGAAMLPDFPPAPPGGKGNTDPALSKVQCHLLEAELGHRLKLNGKQKVSDVVPLLATALKASQNSKAVSSFMTRIGHTENLPRPLNERAKAVIDMLLST